MHRILMPDGSEFVYENIQQNAEPTGDSIAKENSRKRLSISSASNNSIPHNSEKSTEAEKKVSTDGKVVQMSLAEVANPQAAEDIDTLIKSAGIEGEATEIREELADLYDRARHAPSRRLWEATRILLLIIDRSCNVCYNIPNKT